MRYAHGQSYFNPRTPCGVRRFDYVPILSHLAFQSTHPLRGATASLRPLRPLRHISIHAPLAGCDGVISFQAAKHAAFQSTHPLRGATKIPTLFRVPMKFQSTHPLRGATGGGIFCFRRRGHFNPRTPCGVRHSASMSKWCCVHFNPRTPCGVRPGASGTCRLPSRYFNPRTPCGVRQTAAGMVFHVQQDFNPRTPCGVRQTLPMPLIAIKKFQSTHPLRGATYPRTYALPPKKISIHAPLAGCDLPTKDIVELIEIFQSTHPLRGATRHGRLRYGRIRISIHAPLAGCDKTPVTQVSASRISIHAPLAGCDAVAMASATSSV